MKTITHYQFTSDEAGLLSRLEGAVGRLSNFRSEAEAAMMARGDERPLSGWHALVRGGDFEFDQFLHACEYLREIIKVAESRVNPDPAMAESVREAVDAAKAAHRELNEVVTKAMR